MSKQPVGIGDLSIYIPHMSMQSDVIIEQRGDSPELLDRLQKAVVYTGQKEVRFPNFFEDTVTLALESGYQLFQRNSPDHLRFMVSGTETSIDMSKPISSYMQSPLVEAGVALPKNMLTFQVQHACASGAVSMLTVAGLLAASSNDKDSGLVISTDIARYQKGSTAEVTQGAGAVSLLIEKNPRLIELDLNSVGYFSKDVDDFFRPLGSDVAQVRGRYSLKCYREALEKAMLDHCEVEGVTPADYLRSVDMFVLHVPYYSLPFECLRALIRKYLKLTKPEAEEFLQERGFQSSIKPAKVVGNLYSSSLFMALISLLNERRSLFGDDISGKKIMFGSYGSGNTMAVFSGVIAKKAGEVIDSWDMDAVFNQSKPVSFDKYEEWVNRKYAAGQVYNPPENFADEISENKFYLAAIREDGFRKYGVKEG